MKEVKLKGADNWQPIVDDTDKLEFKKGDPDQAYSVHWRRAQEGSDKACLKRFHESDFAKRLQKATITEKRPQGVKVRLCSLHQHFCTCTATPVLVAAAAGGYEAVSQVPM